MYQIILFKLLRTGWQGNANCIPFWCFLLYKFHFVINEFLRVLTLLMHKRRLNTTNHFACSRCEDELCKYWCVSVELMCTVLSNLSLLRTTSRSKKEKNICWRKLNIGIKVMKICHKFFKFSFPMNSNIEIASIYLNPTIGRRLCVLKNLVSVWSMKRHA